MSYWSFITHNSKELQMTKYESILHPLYNWVSPHPGGLIYTWKINRWWIKPNPKLRFQILKNLAHEDSCWHMRFQQESSWGVLEKTHVLDHTSRGLLLTNVDAGDQFSNNMQCQQLLPRIPILILHHWT